MYFTLFLFLGLRLVVVDRESRSSGSLGRRRRIRREVFHLSPPLTHSQGSYFLDLMTRKSPLTGGQGGGGPVRKKILP